MSGFSVGTPDPPRPASDFPGGLSVPSVKAGEFVLGVDLDGVVADYEEGFRLACMEMMGLPREAFPEASSWSFVASGWPFASEREFFAAHRAAVEGGLFERLEPVQGASEALWRLSDAGVRIRVITHRLVVNFSHRAAVSDTVSWLDEQRIPFRDICFVRDKAEVGADLYLDDSPGNVSALRSAAGSDAVAVFDRPYNSHVDGLRVSSWTEVLDLVSSRLGR